MPYQRPRVNSGAPMLPTLPNLDGCQARGCPHHGRQPALFCQPRPPGAPHCGLSTWPRGCPIIDQAQQIVVDAINRMERTLGAAGLAASLHTYTAEPVYRSARLMLTALTERIVEHWPRPVPMLAVEAPLENQQRAQTDGGAA